MSLEKTENFTTDTGGIRKLTSLTRKFCRLIRVYFHSTLCVKVLRDTPDKEVYKKPQIKPQLRTLLIISCRFSGSNRNGSATQKEWEYYRKPTGFPIF